MIAHFVASSSAVTKCAGLIVHSDFDYEGVQYALDGGTRTPQGQGHRHRRRPNDAESYCECFGEAKKLNK